MAAPQKLSCFSKRSSPSISLRRRAAGKPVASGQLLKQETLTQPPSAEMQVNEERRRNQLQEYEQRFEKLSEDQKISSLCSEARWRSVEGGQSFSRSSITKRRRKSLFMPRVYVFLEIKKELV